VASELIITRENRHGIELVKFQGDLGAESVAQMRVIVAELRAEGKQHIIFELDEVEYMSSVGLGELAKVHNSLLHACGRLVILRPGKKVMELFRLTRMDTVLNVCHEEEETWKYFQDTGR